MELNLHSLHELPLKLYVCVCVTCPLTGRRLVSAVRQGRAYFALLQKEEQEQEEELRKERQRKEAWLRAEPRPPRWSSDSDSDEPDQ